MKKTRKNIFIAACLIICMIPSVCMFFARSDQTIGNEMTVAAPSLQTKDGAFNTEILSDAGNYFEHHFAFRPLMITADAKVMSGLFGVSNTDTVVTGTDGWLYYTATLDNFLGRNALSARGIKNLAHNISIIRDYAEAHGARFLFMVPPNKNSLYGGNMPYYYGVPASGEHDRDHLSSAMQEAGITYPDLYELFKGKSEVLYLKEDSHWDNRGAALVTDAVLDLLGKSHKAFSDAPASRARTHDGDLRAMIFPADPSPEYDYTFDVEKTFEYIKNERTAGEEVSVEDFLVEAQNDEGSGRLLMYRDSFANNLIPFLAGSYAYSVYNKAVPGNIAADIEKYGPDTVILEKAERNIRDFLTSPYIVPAPGISEAEAGEKGLVPVTPLEINSGPCMADTSYTEVSGTLGDEDVSPDTRIYLCLEEDGERRFFEAFNITTGETDNGFTLYLRNEEGVDMTELLSSCKVYASG